MSKNNNQNSISFRSILFAVILVLTSSSIAKGGTCPGATHVDLNSTLRAYGGEQGEYFVVKLEIPSAGILSVDVAAPNLASAAPRVGLAGRGCGTQASGQLTILDRSASHMVLATQEPGTYLFRLASRDPTLALGEFKLRTAFTADSRTPPLLDKGGEDEEELESEPDSLIHDVAGGQSRTLQSRLHQLCRRGEVDDHGDSFTCATFVRPGHTVAGEIRNGWGDDGDVFMFVVGGSRGADLWTVEIETSSGVDTFGELYDRSGQRLERIDDSGDGENSRIVRTVAPGTYFVRVEGSDGAEGEYELRIDAQPW